MKTKKILLIALGVLILAAISIILIGVFRVKNTDKKYSEYQQAILGHEWLSFNYGDTYIFNNKNGESVQLIYFNEAAAYKITKDSLYMLNFLSEDFESYSRGNEMVENQVLSLSQLVPFDVFSTFSWQLKPYAVESVTINGKEYDKFYKKDYLFQDDSGSKNLSNKIKEQKDIYLFFNKETKLLDSGCVANGGKTLWEFNLSKTFSFDDRSAFVNSMFDENNPRYSNYTHCHDINKSSSFITVDDNCDSTRLSQEILEHPMLTLSGDTTNIGKLLKGWTLMDFCMTGCRPCFQQLERFKNEKDSFGSYIVESQGINPLFINSTTWRLDLVRQVAEKYYLPNSFAAKGLLQHSDLPRNPGYVLVSPSGDVVYKSSALGDYSELFKAKQEYEQKHQSK